MIFFNFLAIYLICSFSIIYIFSNACGLSNSRKDRRNKDRRKGIRQNCLDRRVSNNFNTVTISKNDEITEYNNLPEYS